MPLPLYYGAVARSGTAADADAVAAATWNMDDPHRPPTPWKQPSATGRNEGDCDGGSERCGQFGGVGTRVKTPREIWEAE